MFETEHQSPYLWNLHYDDVGHTLVLGATGSGKSFLLNFILTHAQKYDPTTVIFDLGGGYEQLTARLGGSVWRMGLAHRRLRDQPVLPGADGRAPALPGVLRPGAPAAAGRPAVTTRDDREIDEAVENLYALDRSAAPACARWHNLLPRALAQQLHRWVQGGPYAQVFDNAEDTLTFQRVQCFDFQGLEDVSRGARAAAVLCLAPRERRRAGRPRRAAEALRARRGLALRRGPHRARVHQRGA